MAIRSTFEQLIHLGRRITGNVIDITMALLKEASGYSRHMQTLYTFLSGVLPTTEAPQWAGADYSTPTYEAPRVVSRPTSSTTATGATATGAASRASSAVTVADAPIDVPTPVDRAARVSGPAKAADSTAKGADAVAPVVDEPVAASANEEPLPASGAAAEAASSAALAPSSEEELASLTKKELQAKCDAAGISYKSKDSKATLIELLLA
ncbi:MAG: hypothetical protein KC609_17405 [Myxococcales bacterium]|nr:hypothetical protein [Myxococcales bacterium]